MEAYVLAQKSLQQLLVTQELPSPSLLSVIVKRNERQEQEP